MFQRFVLVRMQRRDKSDSYWHFYHTLWFDADSVPIIEKSPDDNPTELSVEFGTGLVYTSFTNWQISCRPACFAQLCVQLVQVCRSHCCMVRGCCHIRCRWEGCKAVYWQIGVSCRFVFSLSQPFRLPFQYFLCSMSEGCLLLRWLSSGRCRGYNLWKLLPSTFQSMAVSGCSGW